MFNKVYGAKHSSLSAHCHIPLNLEGEYHFVIQKWVLWKIGKTTFVTVNIQAESKLVHHDEHIDGSQCDSNINQIEEERSLLTMDKTSFFQEGSRRDSLCIDVL